MIYLDYGATSLHKPPAVRRAVLQAMERCANPGRGGYPAARAAHLPRAAATPAGYPGRRRGTVSSGCDGISPHLNPGGAATRRGYPGAGYRAAGEKKFPAGAATPGENPRIGLFARI